MPEQGLPVEHIPGQQHGPGLLILIGDAVALIDGLILNPDEREQLRDGVGALPFEVVRGLVEGLITAAVLCFVHEARPELLWGVPEGVAERKPRMSFRKTIAILAAVAAGIGGVLALFASALPDGLEWAMERVAGTAELEAAGGVYDVAAGIQEKTAFLPDYALKEIGRAHV